MGFKYFITVINKLLSVNLSITNDNVKAVVTALYTAYEIKHSTQYVTFTANSTPSTSTSGIRGKNV